MLETPLELGSGRTAVLTEDRLRAMVAGYYAARGWDAEGRPEPEDLAGLGLGDLCPRVFTAVVTTVNNR